MYKRNKLEVVLASYTQVGSNDDLSFFRKKIEFEVRICFPKTRRLPLRCSVSGTVAGVFGYT